jgi:hypothetical protein
MPTADSSASKEVVTAALLVIGGKILSGRTKDQNIGYIAEYLTAIGSSDDRRNYDPSHASKKESSTPIRCLACHREQPRRRIEANDMFHPRRIERQVKPGADANLEYPA